jgi:LDH2 family malate/lactate/ureidoglycolate dehydrogenase
MSCALSGAGLPGSGPPDNIGHTCLAIDPAAFGATARARDYVDALIDYMHQTTRLDPTVPVLVAGNPRT